MIREEWIQRTTQEGGTKTYIHTAQEARCVVEGSLPIPRAATLPRVESGTHERAGSERRGEVWRPRDAEDTMNEHEQMNTHGKPQKKRQRISCSASARATERGMDSGKRKRDEGQNLNARKGDVGASRGPGWRRRIGIRPYTPRRRTRTRAWAYASASTQSAALCSSCGRECVHPVWHARCAYFWGT
ncbi:hypothetical protein DFH09DRAFT_1286685 [Mycena vulgaris]|nr:hypothetical protein DFH09DRAFT_1286685 [Mycena vulgaris]